MSSVRGTIVISSLMLLFCMMLRKIVQTQVLGLLLSNTVFMVNVCHAFINILIAVDMILVLKNLYYYLFLPTSGCDYQPETCFNALLD